MQEVILKVVGLETLKYRFYKACKEGNYKALMKYLMKELNQISEEECADVFFHRDDQVQRTVLHALIYNNKVEQEERANMAFSLLQYCEMTFPDRLKAFMDAQDAEGRTALMLAASTARSFELVKLLLSGRHGDTNLSAHANRTLRDLYGFNALHLAAYKGYHESALLLMHYGLPLSLFSYQGETPVLLAAAMGHLRTLKVLMENVSEKERLCLLNQWVDRSGNTPLHHASMKHFDKTALFLIEQGADLNLTNHAGLTPHDYATLYGRIYAGTDRYNAITDEHLLTLQFENYETQVKKVKAYMERDLHFHVFYLDLKDLIDHSLSLKKEEEILEIFECYTQLYQTFKNVYHIVYYPGQCEDLVAELKTYPTKKTRQLMDRFIEQMKALQPTLETLNREKYVLNSQLEITLRNIECLIFPENEETYGILIKDFNERWAELQRVQDQYNYAKGQVNFLCEIVKRMSDAIYFVDKKNALPFEAGELPLETVLCWAQSVYATFSRATHERILTLEEDPLGLKQAWSKQDVRASLFFPNLLPEENTEEADLIEESLVKIADFLQRFPMPQANPMICFDYDSGDIRALLPRMRDWLGDAVHVLPVNQAKDDPYDLGWRYHFQQQLADCLGARGVLDKPVVCFLREEMYGGVHYSVLVLLPAIYHLQGTGLDSAFDLGVGRIFYINPMDLSLLPNPELIHLLTDGLLPEDTHLIQKTEGVELHGPLIQALMPDAVYSPPYIQGRMEADLSDNLWWCLYTTLQIILTSTDDFLNHFEGHFGQRATLLRNYFGSFKLEREMLLDVETLTEEETGSALSHVIG